MSSGQEKPKLRRSASGKGSFRKRDSIAPPRLGAAPGMGSSRLRGITGPAKPPGGGAQVLKLHHSGSSRTLEESERGDSYGNGMHVTHHTVPDLPREGPANLPVQVDARSKRRPTRSASRRSSSSSKGSNGRSRPGSGRTEDTEHQLAMYRTFGSSYVMRGSQKVWESDPVAAQQLRESHPAAVLAAIMRSTGELQPVSMKGPLTDLDRMADIGVHIIDEATVEDEPALQRGNTVASLGNLMGPADDEMVMMRLHAQLESDTSEISKKLRKEAQSFRVEEAIEVPEVNDTVVPIGLIRKQRDELALDTMAVDHASAMAKDRASFQDGMALLFDIHGVVARTGAGGNESSDMSVGRHSGTPTNKATTKKPMRRGGSSRSLPGTTQGGAPSARSAPSRDGRPRTAGSMLQRSPSFKRSAAPTPDSPIGSKRLHTPGHFSHRYNDEAPELRRAEAYNTGRNSFFNSQSHLRPASAPMNRDQNVGFRRATSIEALADAYVPEQAVYLATGMLSARSSTIGRPSTATSVMSVESLASTTRAARPCTGCSTSREERRRAMNNDHMLSPFEKQVLRPASASLVRRARKQSGSKSQRGSRTASNPTRYGHMEVPQHGNPHLRNGTVSTTKGRRRVWQRLHSSRAKREAREAQGDNTASADVLVTDKPPDLPVRYGNVKIRKWSLPTWYVAPNMNIDVNGDGGTSSSDGGTTVTPEPDGDHNDAVSASSGGAEPAATTKPSGISLDSASANPGLATTDMSSLSKSAGDGFTFEATEPGMIPPGTPQSVLVSPSSRPQSRASARSRAKSVKFDVR